MDNNLLELLSLTDDPSPMARGKRLVLLRKISGLNRSDFAKKYDLNIETVRSWEDGRKTGLSEKGARTMVRAFLKEGINCNTGWLLYGKGRKPEILHTGSHQNLALYEDKEPQKLPSEVRVFMEEHPDGIYLKIEDDGMEPLFSINDYVAGMQYFGEDIPHLMGKYCIIETKAGDKYVRLLQAGTVNFTYSLFCINPRSTVNEPVIYNVKIISAAPIVLIRKPDIGSSSANS